MCMYVYVGVCMCMCMYVYVCICMYMYVYVCCVCMYGDLLTGVGVATSRFGAAVALCGRIGVFG